MVIVLPAELPPPYVAQAPETVLPRLAPPAGAASLVLSRAS